MTGEGPRLERLETLVREARAGSIEAFEELLRLHGRAVLRVGLRLLGRLEDAEDIAQEVFLKLHANLGRFDGSRELGPWLYRVTVNQCLDLRRRRQFPAPVWDEADARPGPEAQALLAERARAAGWALARLPDKERAALVLREIEGLSTREVAEALGSTETTVRAQICQARLKLRRLAGERRGGKQ